MSFCDGFSDDEDDTAELLAELERIKKERAEEKARKVLFKPLALLLLILSVKLFCSKCEMTNNIEVGLRGFVCVVSFICRLNF